MCVQNTRIVHDEYLVMYMIFLLWIKSFTNVSLIQEIKCVCIGNCLNPLAKGSILEAVR